MIRDPTRGRSLRLRMARRAAQNQVVELRPSHDDANADTDPGLAVRRGLPGAERRQLTILFCDLVASTELSEHLDPEVLHELVLAYHGACAAAVERYQGTIAHLLGDGVVVMFGYPQAHEDDAERAVHCGCEMLERIAALPQRPPLEARIGIHTGAVVIGKLGAQIGRAQVLPMSLTSNLAARLQAHADPNTVLISQATYHLVPGRFATRTLPPAVLKGIEKPVPVYQVLHPTGVRSRLEAARVLTPFVGRESEVGRLRRAWARVQEGGGETTLIVGEPGQGKSRLLLALREALGAAPWLECRANPLAQNSAFEPVLELLRRASGETFEGDDDAARLQALEAQVDALGEPREEGVPLLAPLFNVPLRPPYEAPPLGAGLRRSKTIALLARWLLSLAGGQPALFVFEDAHWADRSSLEVLRRVIDAAPDSRMLVLLTARPELAPPSSDATLHTMTLHPLSAVASRRMLTALGGGQALPEDLERRIVERTNGVPLFLEEVTKHLLESGQLVRREGGQLEAVGAIADISIPATLQDSLTARLDRLGDAREVAQVAAVVGREIPHVLLARLRHRDDMSLARNLERLLRSGLLYARGEGDEATYVFKHALVQEAAYGSLLKSTRKQLHGQIAEAIERHFPERAQSDPALLAGHYENAGLVEPAVRFHHVAAHRAAARVADKEAIEHAERALRLSAEMESDAQSDAIELDLALLSARCHINQFGYASETAARNLARARRIAISVADHAVRFRSTIELFLVNNGLARFDEALALAEELRAPANGRDDAQEKLGGAVCATMVHLAQGAPRRALDLLETVDAPTDPVAALESLSISPMVHAVVRLIFQSWAEWLLGYPDRARRTCESATDLAEACGYAPTIAHTLALGPTFLAIRLGEPAPVPALCARLRDWTQRYGLVLWGSYADLLEGIARCQLGERELSVIRLVADCIARRRAIGSRLWQTMFWGMLAEQCVLGGWFEEAQRALDQGFEAHRAFGERLWLAELHRVEGELRWSGAGDADAAQTAFERALQEARDQGARAFELRAATSLARLWRERGQPATAQNILRPVLSCFTEGFETRDLVEARDLLESLGRRAA